MASLDEIRSALASTIDNHTEREIFVYSKVEDLGRVPAVIIEPASADFEGAFQRGMDTWEFNLFVLCSVAGDSATGQELLDQLVSGSGVNSIREILYDHADLGLGDGTDAQCSGLRGYGGRFKWSSVAHVGAVLKVRVITSGRV